jgi:hypothetical protein
MEFLMRRLAVFFVGPLPLLVSERLRRSGAFDLP